MRQAVRRQARTVTRDVNYPAPIGGWVRSQAYLKPKAGTARLMRNAFPTLRGVRVRGGQLKIATLPTDVLSIFSYQAGGIASQFAATASDVYDITNVADPDVTPAAEVAGQTSGVYSVVTHANVGGTFNLLFNGSDLHQVFDGAAWAANTPAITFTDVGVTNTAEISSGWIFKNRLFMVEKDSLNAHYLPVDTIGGAADKFSLAGVFSMGGKLLFGATWSQSAGDGPQDRCAFFSNLGQVAIYQGSNPGDANDWDLVGVYFIGEPLGERSVVRTGGDLIIGTHTGMIPLSKALVIDVAALSLASVSFDINDEWSAAIKSRGQGFGWSILKSEDDDLTYVSLPSKTGIENGQFVINNLSGKWCEFVGWDVQCMHSFDDRMYFGSANGKVYLSDSGGNDDGMPYYVSIVTSFDAFKRPNRTKIASMMRATFLSSTPFLPKYSVSRNYKLELPSVPSAAPDTASSDLWDTGIWDTAVWDSSGEDVVVSNWKSVFGDGYSLALNLQITISSTIKPDIELVSFDFMYEEGGKVVR